MTHDPLERSSTRGDPDTADVAAGALAAPNPMIGFSLGTLLRGLTDLGKGVAGQPEVLARAAAHFGAETARILTGQGTTDPATDRRFNHSAWTDHFPYTAAAQMFLAWRTIAYRTVESSLDGPAEERAMFAAALVVEALAPTNSLLNPAALERAWDTRGRSVVDGARNLVDAVRHNGGLPALAKLDRFTVGVDLAATPGAVVLRTPVFELIQFTPQTTAVHAVPVLMIPSPVNKYYLLDMAPGRSLVEYAARHEIQVFTISWRNVTASQASWSMTTYIDAVAEASEAVATISSADAVNVLGVCAGGVIAACHLGHRAATGQPAPPAAAFLVAGIDSTWPSAFGALSTMTGADLAMKRSRRQGMLSGRELSRAFALMRPQELIWNVAVSNYLMGNDPPGSDILAWNVDLTNVPAGLHADLIRMLIESPLTQPGRYTVHGLGIDLGEYDGDTYTLGALADHIVPWQTCYRGARHFGGSSRFVAASGGHVQSLVNPPGNKRSRIHTGTGELPEDPAEWLASATVVQDTWWNDWLAWLSDRSGEKRKSADRLGSVEYPVLMRAPGRHALQVAQ